MLRFRCTPYAMLCFVSTAPPMLCYAYFPLHPLCYAMLRSRCTPYAMLCFVSAAPPPSTASRRGGGCMHVHVHVLVHVPVGYALCGERYRWGYALYGKGTGGGYALCGKRYRCVCFMWGKAMLMKWGDQQQSWMECRNHPQLRIK